MELAALFTRVNTLWRRITKQGSIELPASEGYGNCQLSGCGLRLQHRAPSTVHRHALELHIQCGQQTNQFEIWLLAPEVGAHRRALG